MAGASTLRSGPINGRRWPWLAGLFLLHALPFLSRPALIGGDEPHYAVAAHSLATDGDVALRDDYAEVAAGGSAAGRAQRGAALEPHLRNEGGREVFSHPLGLPLLMAPFLALQEALLPGKAPDLLLGLLGLCLTFSALLAGFRLLARTLGDGRAAVLSTLGAYFASPLWFGSRTFFTEPYTWAFAVLAVAALAADHLALAALLLGLTLAMKETALLLVIPILAVTGWRSGLRRAFLAGLGPLAWGLFFICRNTLEVGRPFATFQPYRVGSPVEGALGLLTSPACGLVWLAPLLLLGGLGFLPSARQRELKPELLACGFVFASYFVVTAGWVDWRGGSGFGPRLLVPALPALLLPLGIAVERFSGRPWFRWLAGALFLAGFTVEWVAALKPFRAFWADALAALLTGALPEALLGLTAGGALLVAAARWRARA